MQFLPSMQFLNLDDFPKLQYNLKPHTNSYVSLYRTMKHPCLEVQLSNYHYLGNNLMVIDERNKFIVLNDKDSDFALCVDEIIGIRSLDKNEFQESHSVFPSNISENFPSFLNKNEDLLLVMKPEVLINSKDIKRYKK